MSWLIALSACSAGSESTVDQADSSFTAEQVLGFEDAGAWSGPGIVGTVDEPTTEGSAALAVKPRGFSLYRSVPFAEVGVPRAIAFDLYEPTMQPNPYWLGAVQLYLECPTHGLYNAYVGQVELTGLPLGTFDTLTFPIASWLQDAAADCPALTIEIALNVSGSPGTYYLDRAGIQTDLILHYTFDDASRPAEDSSGYGRDGTFEGNATLGAGRTGTGLVLDGNGSYVTLPAGITDRLDAYTIAAWVDMADARPWARIFDFGGETGFTYLAADRGDGTLQLSIYDGFGNEGIVNGPAVATGAWKHVAVTAHGDDFRVYVDGVEAENQLTVPVAPGDIGANDQGNWIGKSRFGDPFLHATIDDFRIYDRVLSEDEIRALAAPGTDYHDYRFDHGDGTDVVDSSALAANGAAFGATSVRDGVYGGALALHGDGGYVQLPDGIVSTCSEFTGAAWVKLHSNQPWNRIFDLGKSDLSSFLYLTAAGFGAAGQEIHAGLVAPTGIIDLGFPFVVQLDEWNHFAVTLRGGTLSIFFNGRQVASRAGVTVKPSDMGITDHDFLGRSQFGDPGFDGELDDVRLSCRGYAPGEIAQLAHLPLVDPAPQTLALSGDTTNVHDPAIIAERGTYYVYSTAGGLQIRTSRDLVHWTFQGSVFQAMPAWVTTQLGLTSLDNLWAPDVSYFGGTYNLFYAASSFGVNNSCIGHAIKADLASSEPWTDLGPVLCTTSADDWNAIDPHVVLDAAGTPWMSAGSFWSGIHLFQLELDGTRADANRYDLAETASTAIEASYIVYNAPYYYLFASYDACCQGAASTYHVQVGRATSITGPYFDRTGLDMRIGGGSPVVLGDSRFAGPGSNAILRIGPTWWNVYHAYDALGSGIPTLRIAQLFWNQGWPVPEQP
ncbi:MAG TPA: LamG-like jellyroll fold domain-containing protein [Kofleriaceae bacterium]